MLLEVDLFTWSNLKSCRGVWNDIEVVISLPRSTTYRQLFVSGLHNTRILQGPWIVVMLGYCIDPPLLVTQVSSVIMQPFVIDDSQYHPQGDPSNYLKLTRKKGLDAETLSRRFQLSLDFLHILAYLHNHPLGSFVICDGSDPERMVYQHLITAEWRLILSDVEDMPAVNRTTKEPVECKTQASKENQAPEQQLGFASTALHLHLFSAVVEQTRRLTRSSTSGECRKCLKP
jgi:glycoprotein-mannosyl O6-kinase